MAKEPTTRNVTKKHLARLERERIQRRYLLMATGVVVVLVLGIILFGVLDQVLFQRVRPVARVGGENITAGDFQKQVRYTRTRMLDELIRYSSDPLYIQFMGSYLQQLHTQLSVPTEVGQQVIDSMIEDKLVAQEAARRGITVSEDELNKAFEEAFGFFEAGTPTTEPTSTPFAFSTSTLSPQQQTLVPPTATATETQEPEEATATPAEESATATPEPTAAAEEAEPTADVTATPAVTATITPTATPYTREGYEGQVDEFLEGINNTGYTRNDLREMIRKQLLKQKVYEAITADVEPVTEQVWVRHILVATEAEAQTVIERLNSGEDFAKLATELSTDTGSAANGGMYDWFGPGRMVAPFEEAAYSLEIGEISEPVATDFGYHVIQLLGKEERPMDQEQLDSARSKAYQDWLEQAKTEADVTTFEDEWQQVVPTTPAVPPEVTALLQQALQPQQQQQPSIPDDLLLTSLPDEDFEPAGTPEAEATQTE